MCSSAWAIFPDVDSMLHAAEPSVCAAGSEICNLIDDLNALEVVPQQHFDALQTLIPVADGSLRAASDGAMRQVLSSINERLILVKVKNAYTGFAAGDELQTKKKMRKTNSTETKPLEKEIKETEKSAKDPEDGPVEKDKTLTKTEPNTKSAADQAKTASSDKVTNTKEVVKEKDKSDASDKTAVKVEATDKNAAKKETTDKAVVKDATEKEKEKTTEKEKTAEVNKIIKHGLWLQILGDDITQKNRHQVPGYDAQVLGAVIGRDYLVTPQLTVGLAGGYQHADVKSRGPSGSFMGIKRFQATLYAGYNFICPFYLHAALTAAKDDYDNNRKILVPPINGTPNPFVRIAQADFDAWEANAYLETGYVWICGNFRAIPKVMLMYSHLDIDDYDEKDALDLDLHVQYHHMDSLPLGAGAKFDYINEFDNAYVVPEIHAYVFYDFINDTQIATANMLGGGFAFYSQGAKAADTSVEIGAGIAVHSYQNTAVFMQYDFVAKNDYHRHQAFIKIRHEWA